MRSAKKFILFLLALVTMAGVCLVTSSCQQQQIPPPVETIHIPTAYETFVETSGNYPEVMSIYVDEDLMQQANKKSEVYICLSQQRGRLYVNDTVAADWPVSTGVDKHPTPTGKFRIRLKKKDHTSNRYGRMYDANGKCINRDADAFNDPIPEGGHFEGSPMPNWMRLTSDGVGMHTGKVRAGRRLSHGCIRTPHYMACRLFDVTDIGTRVYITDEPEAKFPARHLLQPAPKQPAEASAAAGNSPAPAPAAAETAPATPFITPNFSTR